MNTKKILFCTLIALFAVSLSIISFADQINHKDLLEQIGIIIPEKVSSDQDSLITRQETVSILNEIYKDDSKKENFSLPENPTFIDVPASSPYYYEIELANYLGITTGIGNGKFGPEEKVKGNQAILLILKSLGYYTGDIFYSCALDDANYLFGTSVSCRDYNAQNPLTKNQFYEILYRSLTYIAGYNNSDVSFPLRTKNLDKINVEGFNGDQSLINAYKALSDSNDKMKNFFNSYIKNPSNDPLAPPIYELISKDQFIEETKFVDIVSCGNDIYFIEEYGYFCNEISSVFTIDNDNDDDEKNKKARFSIFSESNEGCAETYGDIMSIRKYPEKDGEIPYIIVLDESYDAYDSIRKTSYNAIQRGYIGFLYNPKTNFYRNSIIDTVYLKSYYSRK